MTCERHFAFETDFDGMSVSARTPRRGRGRERKVSAVCSFADPLPGAAVKKERKAGTSQSRGRSHSRITFPSLLYFFFDENSSRPCFSVVASAFRCVAWKACQRCAPVFLVAIDQQAVSYRGYRQISICKGDRIGSFPVACTL